MVLEKSLRWRLTVFAQFYSQSKHPAKSSTKPQSQQRGGCGRSSMAFLRRSMAIDWFLTRVTNSEFCFWKIQRIVVTCCFVALSQLISTRIESFSFLYRSNSDSEKSRISLALKSSHILSISHPIFFSSQLFCYLSSWMNSFNSSHSFLALFLLPPVSSTNFVNSSLGISSWSVLPDSSRDISRSCLAMVYLSLLSSSWQIGWSGKDYQKGKSVSRSCFFWVLEK